MTTELVLRGPDYVGIWISIGIEVAGGRNVSEVVEAVKTRIKAFLSPLPAPDTPMPQLPMLYGPEIDPALRGLGVRGRVREAQVREIFGDLVGPALSPMCRALTLERGVLVIGVSNTALSHQIHLDSVQLIASLNERLGAEAVRRLRFTMLSG